MKEMVIKEDETVRETLSQDSNFNRKTFSQKEKSDKKKLFDISDVPMET